MKAVIFDNENVLVATDWDRVSALASRVMGTPVESGSDFKKRLKLYHNGSDNPLDLYGQGPSYLSGAEFWSIVVSQGYGYGGQGRPTDHALFNTATKGSGVPVSGQSAPPVYEVNVHAIREHYAKSLDRLVTDRIEGLSAAMRQLTTTPNQPAIELVKELKGLGYRVLMLSNAIPEITEGNMSRDDYYSLFDAVYLSWKTGFKKSSARAFTNVLEKEGLEPRDAFFVDDTPENVRMGEIVGIPGVVYSEKEDIKKVRCALLSAGFDRLIPR